MHRLRKIPSEIPADHPFVLFLARIPINPDCDPYPDIIESAASSRYFVAFMGENSSARLNGFLELIKGRADTGAQLVTQHISASQARAVIFLTRFSPLISRTVVVDDDEGSDWLALMPGGTQSSSAPSELEGCTHQPSY